MASLGQGEFFVNGLAADFDLNFDDWPDNAAAG